jgi:flagellar protein FlaG
MKSYSVDNLAVWQGSYANVVAAATPQSSRISRQKASDSLFPVSAESAVTPDKALPAAKPAAGSVPAAEVKSDKPSLLEVQKLKYEEIAKDENKMNAITEILNKFMAQFSADAQFFWHKDASIISVKFVDLKNNKVLKEFPPEEYLEMIANIRKYIGAIVDEKI